MTNREKLQTNTAELEVKKEQIKRLQKELISLENKQHQLKEQVKFEELEPSISDHALLRYFERKEGVSFEDVRQQLLSSNLRNAINLGASKFKSSEGIEFIIKDKKVVTVQ